MFLTNEIATQLTVTRVDSLEEFAALMCFTITGSRAREHIAEFKKSVITFAAKTPYKPVVVAFGTAFEHQQLVYKH